MAREKTGELICLNWDEFFEPEFFIRGHVSDADGVAELENQEVLDKCSNNYVRGEDRWKWRDFKARLEPGVHRYGRWSMEPGEDSNHHVLRDYGEPGRGRFPVTKFTVAEWEEVPCSTSP